MVLGDREFLQIRVSIPSTWAGPVARGRGHAPDIHNVIHMVAQRDEQIEEEFPTTLHLRLHGAAPLKRLATSDDQGQVVSAEARVRVRRVVVRVARAAQDRADLDAALQALLAQRQRLQLLEPVAPRGAVHDGVAQQGLARAGDVTRGLDVSATASVFRGGTPRRVLEGPRAAPLVLEQARVVVPLVEVLEHAREDLGLLVGEVDPLARRVEELAPACRREERRQAEHVLVRCEQSSLPTDLEGDDRGGESPVLPRAVSLAPHYLLLASPDTLTGRMETGILTPRRADSPRTTSAISTTSRNP